MNMFLHAASPIFSFFFNFFKPITLHAGDSSRHHSGLLFVASAPSTIWSSSSLPLQQPALRPPLLFVSICFYSAIMVFVIPYSIADHICFSEGCSSNAKKDTEMPIMKVHKETRIITAFSKNVEYK
ncbi:uncharacterized protein LOC130015648 [Mercurialis annua]|uniref:uncharacterized protein LOC130015648 n=1 Tax=Mercurialis annua TaxID=3986 RepID=UPI0024ACECC0|nr:uncharacterized protein LOC130015648 [Mercurialis annua]